MYNSCFKLQPDDSPIGTKHEAVWILHTVVFDGYLFIPSLINIPLYSKWTTSAVNFKYKKCVTFTLHLRNLQRGVLVVNVD